MNANDPSRAGRRHALIAAALAALALAIALVTSTQWQRREHGASAPAAPVPAPAAVSPPPAAPPPATAIGSVDQPLDEAVMGTKLQLAGWALDPSGVSGVEVRLDARSYPARYGVARDDVSKLKPGFPDSAAPGFEFEGDFGPLTPERHELEVVARNRGGGE